MRVMSGVYLFDIQEKGKGKKGVSGGGNHDYGVWDRCGLEQGLLTKMSCIIVNFLAHGRER